MQALRKVIGSALSNEQFMPQDFFAGFLVGFPSSAT
jgi:hypothetical protein